MFDFAIGHLGGFRELPVCIPEEDKEGIGVIDVVQLQLEVNFLTLSEAEEAKQAIRQGFADVLNVTLSRIRIGDPYEIAAVFTGRRMASEESQTQRRLGYTSYRYSVFVVTSSDNLIDMESKLLAIADEPDDFVAAVNKKLKKI